MALAPSSRLGAYEIVAAIGSGGMGEVYKARDTSLGREVAIKVLPEAFASDPERVVRFEREARVLASLNHPNIATIYGLERHGTAAYLAMELVPGATLAERRARGRLPIDEALAIAAQIAGALEAAHDKTIVHRDLKPANIIVMPDGKVKVLDFGLAKALDGGVESAAGDHATARDLTASPTVAVGGTLAGVVLGTAAYMAPEQARGKAVDRRADIWSFGCVLYEMVTGRAAFGGETLTDIVAAVMKNDPDWTALPVDCPPPMRSLMRRCLQKDPGRRLQHAGDARIEIEETLAEPRTRSDNSSGHARRAWTGGLLPWTLLAFASAALVTQFVAQRSVSLPRSVVRLDLNLPFGVELPTANGPNVAVSADGSRIAYFGAHSGLRRLYVRRIDESDATVLRGTETANICFFSPDGQHVAFITADRVLKKVSLGDGLVTTIVPEADYAAAGGFWGDDDRIVFGRNGELWEISASGAGSPRKVSTLDRSKGERAHSWPIPVAGGRTILFTTVTLGPPTAMRIDAIVRATGERRAIVESARYPMYAASGHLVFYRDSALLAAPFDRDALKLTGQPTTVVDKIALDQLGAPLAALSPAGTLAYVVTGSAARRLVWVSRQGLEAPLNETARPYVNPRLGPDGHRIVVELSGNDLWIQDTTRSTFTRLTSGETVGNTFAVWSPDGRRVIFRTVTGITQLDTDGGGRPQSIAKTSVNDVPTSFSPDGRILAFNRQNSEAGGDLYTMALESDSQPRPLVRTPGYDGGGQFSPDGRWMAYVTNESGQFEVYVRPYPGPDRKAQVSTDGGTHPKWNRNGKELFYRTGNKMMVVDVSVRGDEIVLSPPRVLFEQRYAFGSAQTIANYDVSPDGQRFLMVKDDSASGRFNVVLNWLDELKARVPLK